MDFGWIGGPVAVLLIVIANGFFVGSEMAMVASRRNRLEQSRLEGNANAAAALRVADHLDRYIAACQFGITLASLSLGWVGEPAIARLIEGLLQPGTGLAAYVPTHVVATILTFALITALHIVLGELVPKSLSLQRAETMAMLYARPLTAFALVFHWPVAALTWIGNSVLRMGGLEPASGHEMVHTVAELRMLVTGSQKAGVVEESEARIVARAFTFADISAGMVMTPRTSIACVAVDASRMEVVTTLIESRRRRLPVFDGSLDRIIGIVHARDILADLAAGVAGDFDLRSLVRPVTAVPESKGIDELLDELRGASDRMAIIVDEYGGTAGLVTLSDLIAPLIGRIDDGPLLVTGEEPANGEAIAHADGSVAFDGMTRLSEWEEATATTLSEDDHEAADTLGGLVMARLGRIPEPGDAVDLGTHVVVVEFLEGRRVSRVRVRRKGSSKGTP